MATARLRRRWARRFTRSGSPCDPRKSARLRPRAARAARTGSGAPSMYSLAVSDHVMIAHSFVGEIFGPAQQLHGATYAVEIELRRARLDGHGLVCDIGLALTMLK